MSNARVQLPRTPFLHSNRLQHICLSYESRNVAGALAQRIYPLKRRKAMTSKVALPRLTAKNSPIPPEKDKTSRNRLLKTTGPTATYQWHTSGTAQWKCPGICSAAWNGCEMDVNACGMWMDVNGVDFAFTSWQSCSKSRHLCIADNEVDGIGSHANSFNILLQVPGGFVVNEQLSKKQ